MAPRERRAGSILQPETAQLVSSISRYTRPRYRSRLGRAEAREGAILVTSPLLWRLLFDGDNWANQVSVAKANVKLNIAII
jgi:hypothetical protein